VQIKDEKEESKITFTEEGFAEIKEEELSV
jgi:F0F1-type ATP synthase epsilon subunit